MTLFLCSRCPAPFKKLLLPMTQNKFAKKRCVEREKRAMPPRAVMGVAVPNEVAERLQAQQMADNAAELAGLQLDNPEVRIPRLRS